MSLDRATGRTYRIVLRALLAASEGKSVLLVAGNTAELHSLQDTVRMYSPMGCNILNKSHLRLCRDGSLTLALASECHTGKRFDVILEDELLGLTWRHIEIYLEHKKCMEKHT